jgi:hypothetical protein
VVLCESGEHVLDGIAVTESRKILSLESIGNILELQLTFLILTKMKSSF